ncbi:MAG: hypothetical protein SFX72_05855 [Isosphaeraceae bacterium]|nr:hypothetical protein [Isosphaeraceae bacterium]
MSSSMGFASTSQPPQQRPPYWLTVLLTAIGLGALGRSPLPRVDPSSFGWVAPVAAALFLAFVILVLVMGWRILNDPNSTIEFRLGNFLRIRRGPNRDDSPPASQPIASAPEPAPPAPHVVSGAVKPAAPVQPSLPAEGEAASRES